MVESAIKNLVKTLNFFFYRFRYLINYVIIGFFSILLEIVVIKALSIVSSSFYFTVIPGFLSGMILSFILNSRLNFNIPKSRNFKTFILFLTISILSFIINLILISLLTRSITIDYAVSRLISAGLIFTVSYTAHRKITFGFVKKVGVAIYLNKNESVSKIYSKIRYYADFIHLDLVDETFDKNASGIDLSLINEINKTWGIKKMLHIMSKTPSVWIEKLNKNVDIIIFHSEIDESVEKVINLCKKYNKKIGIVLTTKTDINRIVKYLPKINFIQVMGINHLGKSGQLFEPSSLEKIRALNKLKEKYNFDIIFDGGVKTTNVHRIDARYIVSASGLLLTKDPIDSFMKLKTSSRYFSIENQIQEDIIKRVKSVIDSIKFIESGTIVGSFSDTKGVRGLGDIDLVVIVDELTKKKFNIIVSKFEEVKRQLESNYGHPVLINTSFGPLKFNKQGDVVFHLMIYDRDSHKLHCKKSPFTCYDWQRSEMFMKKPMKDIYSVKSLQPSYFFGFRRSAEEYLSEIKSNFISYREYNFLGKKIVEEKRYKQMDKKDQIDFSYHIVKFLMSNFLKMHYRENKLYPLSEMLQKYFSIFPRNKIIHQRLIKDLYLLKKKKKIGVKYTLTEKMELFIKDFESQFKNYFSNSSELIFLRHAETKLNKKDFFIGQKLNPSIAKLKAVQINKLNSLSKGGSIFFSSPLKRCLETIKTMTDKDIFVDNNLNEIDYGEIDGKKLDYLSSHYPEVVSSWKRGEDSKFPGGENNLDVIKRAKMFLGSLEKYNNRKIIVCTHNVFLRSLLGSYLKIPQKDWFKINISHLDPLKFILTRDRKFYLELTEVQIEEIFNK